jgi:two-component system, NarL family, nitrate/nitrite response regulator NarL
MRVVLCDDHRLLLQALATALAARGYSVEAVTTTPEEAVRAVDRCDPDVLLTDLSFPQGSGLDVAAAVRSGHPRTKVVIITGSEDPHFLSQALEVGVSGYVLKGERIEAICDALEAAHRGDVTLDASLVRKLVGGDAALVPRQRGPQHLTPREHHILELLDQGLETHEIVRRLGVSQSTVRTHIQNILSKLGVHTRLEAVVALGDPGRGSGVERA